MRCCTMVLTSKRPSPAALGLRQARGELVVVASDSASAALRLWLRRAGFARTAVQTVGDGRVALFYQAEAAEVRTSAGREAGRQTGRQTNRHLL